MGSPVHVVAIVDSDDLILYTRRLRKFETRVTACNVVASGGVCEYDFGNAEVIATGSLDHCV